MGNVAVGIGRNAEPQKQPKKVIEDFRELWYKYYSNHRLAPHYAQ